MLGIVEPPCTDVKGLCTPCFLCDEVVRGRSRRFDAVEPPRTHVENSTHRVFSAMKWFEKGSRRFDVVEPPRTSVQVPYTPFSPCKDVVREDSA